MPAFSLTSSCPTLATLAYLANITNDLVFLQGSLLLLIKDLLAILILEVSFYYF